MAQLNRIIISGGGTGGHIQPALAIADEIRRRHPACEILFVGARDRMEMQKVPAAGYAITGLDITGIDRNWRSLRNWLFPFRLAKSLWRARAILRQFRPEVAVGVGGFASGPLLFQASRMGIATVIQEQNGFPGITNRLLARRVDRICAGMTGLERWFPKERLVFTGNPLRAGVVEAAQSGADAGRSGRSGREKWGLAPDVPVLFVMGGSLGAASMNAAVRAMVERHEAAGTRPPFQVLWQCGARYLDASERWLAERGAGGAGGWVVCRGYIDDMPAAYAVADVIAGRAGAMSLAELALVGKPAVLVPSPVVAEDHQTRNARVMTDAGGAVLLPDAEVVAKLESTVAELLASPERMDQLGQRIRQWARPDAAQAVVDAIETTLKTQRHGR
jgi:UDP-N-acetylglucosamine--N-acetylmuramyl-(pentapeptide) pyrophosphoryl-undecaprenol N-acetylglucosamine transferase